MSKIDWSKCLKGVPLKDVPIFNTEYLCKPMPPRSDIADAAAYLAMGCPRILGFAPARGPDKAVAYEHAQNRGRTAAIMYDHYGHRSRYGLTPTMIFFDECAPFPNPTERPTMQDQTPTKQFVTHDVPGFEDGTELKLNQIEINRGEYPTVLFAAKRTTEEGVKLSVEIPATPEAFAAHVRVKPVKPPKVEKKA